MRYSELDADLAESYEGNFTLDEITDAEIHADLRSAWGDDDFDEFDTIEGPY